MSVIKIQTLLMCSHFKKALAPSDRRIGWSSVLISPATFLFHQVAIASRKMASGLWSGTNCLQCKECLGIWRLTNAENVEGRLQTFCYQHANEEHRPCCLWGFFALDEVRIQGEHQSFFQHSHTTKLQRGFMFGTTLGHLST